MLYRTYLKKIVFRIRDILRRIRILIVGTSTSVFKDNKSLWSQKTVKIKGFLIFCFLMEGFGSVHKITDPDPGVETQKNLRIRNTVQ
jgi:hypothetical protein